MGIRFTRAMILGLGLLLAALPPAPAVAGAAEQTALTPPTGEKQAEVSAQTPAIPVQSREPERAGGHLGTVVAVVPSSRMLVVDISLGKDVLRVGAEITDQTDLTSAGKTVSLDRLKTGDRVRLEFRRVETGDEAIAVELLPAAG